MYRKILFLLLICILHPNNTFSQSTEDQVIIETLGYGKNQNEAVLDALRNALESSYGVFINSNTTIINDEIIRDEIKTIGSGNILDYQVLEKISLDNEITVKVKSIVSISKMISLGKSNGQQINFNGNVFAKDLKLQELYEKNELHAIQQFLLQYKTYLNNAFDYKISSHSPKFNESDNKYDIEFQIRVISNSNSLSNLILGLKLLSMNLNDAIKYKSLNKEVYPMIISLTEDEEILVILRSKKSYELFVSKFISEPLLAARDLEFNDGLDTYYFDDLFKEGGIVEGDFCFDDCGFWDPSDSMYGTRKNLHLNFSVGKKLEGGDSPSIFNEFYDMSYAKILAYHNIYEPQTSRSGYYNTRVRVFDYDGSLNIPRSGFRGKLNKIFSDTYSSKSDKSLFKEFIKKYRGVAIGTTELNTTWLCNQLSIKKPFSSNRDDSFMKLRFTKSYTNSEIQNLQEFSVKRKIKKEKS